MAERRMFAKSIVFSDAFLDMPLSARCLYFTLGMMGDDEGFVNSPRTIMRQCGASEDDMRVLVAKNFIIPFDSGVVVIKHWRIHNYIRSDRKHKTTYIEEMSKLKVKENDVYTLSHNECQASDYQLPTNCLPVDNHDGCIGEVNKVNKVNKDNIYTSIDEVIDYLNEKAKTNYRHSDTSRKHIKARLNDGFTVDDCKVVVDKKSAEWLGTDMEKYLRPETLFGNKFENYLNSPAARTKSTHKVEAPDYMSLDHVLEDLE